MSTRVNFTSLYMIVIIEGKINYNNANYHDIIMIPKSNAPIHSYKNPRIYYQYCRNGEINGGANFFGSLGNYFQPNKASYGDLDFISDRPPKFNLSFSWKKIAIYFNKDVDFADHVFNGKYLQTKKYLQYLFLHPVTSSFALALTFCNSEGAKGCHPPPLFK